MGIQSCRVEGCEKPVKGLGWCGKHYERWRKYGAVGDDVVHHAWGQQKVVRQCTVPECENKVLALGYCARHYYRWRKYGTVDDSALHHRWGVGKFDKHGYRLIRQNNKTRPEHHIVMEDMIGRPLHKWESVHHKNGVRADNSIDNLELWATSHRSGQRVEDLARWVVENYRDLVESLLKANASSGANPVTRDPVA